MNFDEFSKILSSIESPVILLEGSRTVAEGDASKLVSLAARFAAEFPDAVFRSGGAEGSDTLFAEGVMQVDPERLELVLPDKRKLKNRRNEKRISFEDLTEDEKREICRITKAATPANRVMIEYYENNYQGSLRYKAQYLLRDALKVVGTKRLNFKPVDFAFFYLNSIKRSGGETGRTIRVCELQMVPFIKQEDWLKW
jgi:hypothetical protein